MLSGLIGLWLEFGALKPLGNSPANDLITKTVYWFNPDIFIPILGIWEIAIGLCLLYRPFIRAWALAKDIKIKSSML